MTPDNINDNRMLFNTNPSVGLYNPCVTNTSQQVIAANGTINTESLVLTTQSSTNNGIIINNTNVNFTSLSAPTSNQTLLSNSDNSNKIPTTQWVQSILGSVSGTIYSVRYTTNQTVITPNNCRSIDLLIMGAGGACGAEVISNVIFYGGSGSGANCISSSGLPMSSNISMVLTFSLLSGTGSTTITINNVILGRAFNGNQGQNGNTGVGATVNSTIGVGNTSFSSWYNTYGTAGSSANPLLIEPPSMGSNGCPKGNSSWVQGASGMAQRDISTIQGGGYVLITYHLG
jgi:hypothetical protein